MNSFPKPGRLGKVEFEQKKGKGTGNEIKNYPEYSNHRELERT